VAIARGRFLTQWADADRRLVVTQAADAMLAQWLTDPVRNVPVSAEGSLNGAPGYAWRTVVVSDPVAATLGARTVRLEIFDRRPSNPGVAGNWRTTGMPVLAVDFLVHKAPKIQPLQPVPGGGRR
jgi:hypothetical protein